MNIFNEDSKCPKCGHNSVNVRHCGGGSGSGGWNLTCDCQGYPKSQHLLRICHRCSAQWLEKCLDDAHPLEQLAAEA